jgi:hypothetical protein
VAAIRLVAEPFPSIDANGVHDGASGPVACSYKSADCLADPPGHG